MDVQALIAAAGERPTEDVPIPGTDLVVKVRGLSRAECLQVGKAEGDPQATERTMLVLGVVDPQLTDATARTWLNAAPSEHVDPVTKAIARLSGMLEDSRKAAYKSDGGESGA